jgi:PAS domain-containing protein
VGAVDADLLRDMQRNSQIPANSLFIINRDGVAVPLTADAAATSTTDYPGRVVSKVAETPDDLAKRVAGALMKQPINTTLDGMPCKVRWSVASNNSKVRRLLQTLLGPQFADSDGYPPASARPKWLFPLQIAGIVLGGFFLAIALVRNYYRRRDRLLTEELDDTRRELVEVRAENQRINTILALAGCGIDIVDDQNQIVYADSSLENKYGDWHGHTCHDYFCGSDTPCPGCRRPFPINEHCQRATDPDCTQLRPYDAIGKFQLIQGEATRMIGVPFRDEGGRWLYARVHLPLALVPEEEKV